jgi:DNA-binding MarR family transcriptional regulator
MPDETDWIDTVALPALLRAARSTYAAAIRKALSGIECDDVPRNGIYVIGAIARSGAPLSQIIDELGVSKQAAGQLVDTLVLRGYLSRTVDDTDRRRLYVALTARGEAAAAASRGAVERIDAELERRVGREVVRHARETLAVLAHLDRCSGDNAGTVETTQ